MSKRKQNIRKAVNMFIKQTNKTKFNIIDFREFLRTNNIGKELGHLKNCTDRELSSRLIHTSLKREYKPKGKTIYRIGNLNTFDSIKVSK